MTKVIIKNSLRNADNGRATSSNSEIVLLDHSDYGLVFGLVSSGSNVVALFDDLAELEQVRDGYTNIKKGITPIEMSDSVDVKLSYKKNIKNSLVSMQKVSKYLVKTSKVLYGNKVTP